MFDALPLTFSQDFSIHQAWDKKAKKALPPNNKFRNVLQREMWAAAVIDVIAHESFGA